MFLCRSLLIMKIMNMIFTCVYVIDRARAEVI